jgi:TPR repeat protein
MTRQRIQNDPYSAWDSGDVKAAFRLFRSMAESGDKGAWLNLGYFYDVGLGIRKNRTEALRWYRRAYRAGDSSAASNIATVYRDEGKHRLAFQWFFRAASMNDGDAEVEVAKRLLSGVGVMKDRSRAVTVLKRAVASNRITPAGRDEAVELLKQIKSEA